MPVFAAGGVHAITNSLATTPAVAIGHRGGRMGSDENLGTVAIYESFDYDPDVPTSGTWLEAMHETTAITVVLDGTNSETFPVPMFGALYCKFVATNDGDLNLSLQS